MIRNENVIYGFSEIKTKTKVHRWLTHITQWLGLWSSEMIFTQISINFWSSLLIIEFIGFSDLINYGNVNLSENILIWILIQEQFIFKINKSNITDISYRMLLMKWSAICPHFFGGQANFNVLCFQLPEITRKWNQINLVYFKV